MRLPPARRLGYEARMAALGTIGSLLGWLALALALAGCGYTLAAALTLPRFFARARPVTRSKEPVTLLRPLHGDEPRLADTLATLLSQDHDGPIQLLCGVQRGDDPAIAAVETVRRRFPEARIDLVVDGARHGASGKVSNLVNMSRHSAHPIVVLSDSDIAVAPDWLPRVLAALEDERVGVVTCLYRGRGDAGFWSRFGAAGLSTQFLPGAVFGVAHGLGAPCMGSTIALHRETLAAIGGFAAFVDTLADDYAIGEAVRGLGLEIAVPPVLVTHASAEISFAELWRHELRWGATVRSVVPLAYTLSVIAMPLPLALLGALAHPVAGLTIAVAAVALRFALATRVDAVAGTRAQWWLSLRDCWSFVVFLASLGVRSVEWRGRALTMERDGRIAAERESPAP